MNAFDHSIGGVFIPVRDIQAANLWYHHLLDLPVGNVQFGHLVTIEMKEGPNLVLDSRIYEPGIVYSKPAFHFNSSDIQASYRAIRSKGIPLTSPIEHGHWFMFEDPDGNQLMICQC